MGYNIEKILGDISPKAVGKRIQQARCKKGYSVAELGERVGVSHVTILNVEKGEKLSKQTLVALAREFNDTFSVTWLQEYLDKYGMQLPDFYDSFENKIREIVRDELTKPPDPSKSSGIVTGEITLDAAKTQKKPRKIAK